MDLLRELKTDIVDKNICILKRCEILNIVDFLLRLYDNRSIVFLMILKLHGLVFEVIDNNHFLFYGIRVSKSI